MPRYKSNLNFSSVHVYAYVSHLSVPPYPVRPWTEKKQPLKIWERGRACQQVVLVPPQDEVIIPSYPDIAVRLRFCVSSFL